MQSLLLSLALHRELLHLMNFVLLEITFWKRICGGFWFRGSPYWKRTMILFSASACPCVELQP